MIDVTAVLVAVLVAAITAASLTTLVPDARVRNPSEHIAASRRSTRLARPSILRRSPSTAIAPASLAAWADDLARSLRHGSTLRAALTAVHPDDPSLIRHTEPLRHWLSRGATVGDACDEWADELGGAGPTVRGDRTELLATMAAVLSAIAVLGGTAAAPLDRFAVTMRQRASDDLERGAQSAQATMSARVLTFVPLTVLALLLLTDADVRMIATQPSGAAVIGLGLGLNSLGAWWMRRIVGSATMATGVSA